MAYVKLTFSHDSMKDLCTDICHGIDEKINKWTDEIMVQNNIPDYAKEGAYLVLKRAVLEIMSDVLKDNLADIKVSLDNTPGLNAIHEQEGAVH